MELGIRSPIMTWRKTTTEFPIIRKTENDQYNTYEGANFRTLPII
jgi:hypothetical protein